MNLLDGILRLIGLRPIVPASLTPAMPPKPAAKPASADQAKTPATFEQYFAGRSHWFTPAEIGFLGAGNTEGTSKGLNHLPPADLWPNILPTLRMADAIRDLYGAPIRILSTYRSPAYNKAIGGAGQSYHTRFMAIDLAPVSTAPGEARRLYGCAMILRQRGIISGGLGKYPWGIHIDCGPQREW